SSALFIVSPALTLSGAAMNAAAMSAIPALNMWSRIVLPPFCRAWVPRSRAHSTRDTTVISNDLARGAPAAVDRRCTVALVTDALALRGEVRRREAGRCYAVER